MCSAGLSMKKIYICLLTIFLVIVCCFFVCFFQTIHNTQPDIVMVELCSSRINILQLDEETLLEEAKNINMEKIRLSIKQVGRAN